MPRPLDAHLGNPGKVAPDEVAPDEAAADEVAAGEAGPGEVGGPTGPDPTRYGDWERGGRCIDF